MWCPRRIGFIVRIGLLCKAVYVVRTLSLGLEEEVWQLSRGCLSGPGRRAPDSYTPTCWHRHPPAALCWPSAVLLAPPCLFNRTNLKARLELVFFKRLFLFAVCNKMAKYRAISPFLCMDMTYITCLLKEGFGFKDSTVLQVRESDHGDFVCLFVCLCVVVTEILLFRSTASKEGKQRGDELGPGGDLWLLQKPQYPRRRSLRGTVFHCGASRPPSAHQRPVPLAHKPSHHTSSTVTTTLPLTWNLSALKNTPRTVEKEEKKWNHSIFYKASYFYCTLSS